MEFQHLGVSMDRVQDKIKEAIDEANKAQRALLDQALEQVYDSFESKMKQMQEEGINQLLAQVETLNDT